MGVAVSLALSIVAGALVVRLLRAGTSASLLDLFLGAGLGLGATSIVWFLWLVVAGPPAVGFHITETAAVVGLAAAVVLTRRGRAKPPPAEPVTAGRLRYLVGIALVLVVASSLVAFVVCWLGEPHGHWDAVEIWNMRARFLFRAGADWRDAFLVTFPGAHTDYPLLLPASVARGWGYVGRETTLVPALIALTFTLSAAGALGGFVAALRGPTAGLLAALALLGTASFLRIGFGQIADVPLGFFILAAVGLLCLHDRADGEGRSNLILAGMMAGFAAWMKNEGLLFLVCLFTARPLVRGLRDGWKTAAAELPALLLGAVPVLLVVAYFKTNLAWANDLVSGQGGEATLSRLTDWARYHTIATGFFWEMLYIGPGAVVVLAVAFVLLGRAPPQARRGAALPVLVVSLMLLGYVAVYATTPRDLFWHLKTSLHRLYMHLWPLALLGYFLLVATPEEAMARRAMSAKKG